MSGDDRSRVTIHVDGAARGNPGPAAIGAIIADLDGTPRVKVSSYIGEATNNQAEYRALIVGLREAAVLGARYVDVYSDSQLLVEQVMGNYRVRNAGLKPLFEEAMQLLEQFESYTMMHVPRRQNTDADALANAAFKARHGH